jgi:iduronate 2-sulfatase
MGYSINTKKYHYIEWYAWDHKTGTKGELKNTELFDREEDPNETVNVAEQPSFSKVKAGLAKQLAEGWQRAKPS